MRLLGALLTVLLTAGVVHCGNVLAVFPHTGKSHFFMFEPFIRHLAARGHNVTLISHFPPVGPPSEYLHHISLAGTAEMILFNSLSLRDGFITSPYMRVLGLKLLNDWGQKACDSGLSHSPVRRLIDSKPSFDLVLVEFFNTDCFAIFSRLFNAPLAGIFSSDLMPWHYERFGNPDNPSYVVNHLLGYSSEMRLHERVINTFAAFGSKLYYRIFCNPATDAIIQKHLGKGLPRIQDVVKNASLFLVNSHFSLFQAKPFVPGIVQVGGLHVSPTKKLPQQLQDYLDKSKNGVVYFSLGSTVLGHTMPEEKRLAIARAFSNISFDVVWKWEVDTMPDKPKNVLLQKWVPQNDLLAHPKVKLFVTHSGLMGTEEAVYHGVPLLMIPLFGDQFVNAGACSEKGLGIVLDYNTLNEETFSRALNEVLTDKRYADNARYVSRTFRDRPISAMDNAVYWAEYVMRYRGAPHMRSAAVRLPWYSEYLLDVLGVVVAVVVLVVHVVKALARVCLKLAKKDKSKRD